MTEKVSLEERINAMMREVDAMVFDPGTPTLDQLQARRDRLRELERKLLADPEVAAVLARMQTRQDTSS
jgi:hypothetical protein